MLRKCVWKEGKLRLGVVRICLGGSEFLGYMQDIYRIFSDFLNLGVLILNVVFFIKYIMGRDVLGC